MNAADEVLIALSDGSGGTAGGAAAAQQVVESLARCEDWAALLFRLDGELMHRGWATAVMASVAGGRVRGASVGDSKAWLVESGVELTERQIVKPLLGTGSAFPIVFDASYSGTLLVATDGLWKFARWADIARIASGRDLDRAAQQLVELVRLPSGTFQDDVAVVLCR